MPIINIKIAKGRSVEQRQQFVEAVTKAAVDLLNVEPEWVNVLIDEYDRENWATGGVLHSIKYGKGCGKEGVNSGTIIQKAIPVDLPEILLLQKRAFAEVALWMDNFDLPPLQQTLNDLKKEYESSVILKYISTDGKLVGSVRGYVDSNDVCHVGKLIVHPGYQNQGIGKALMYEIEKYFPACRKFVLFTGEEPPNTLHLYTKVGYRVISKKKTEGLSMFFMEKENVE